MVGKKLAVVGSGLEEEGSEPVVEENELEGVVRKQVVEVRKLEVVERWTGGGGEWTGGGGE